METPDVGFVLVHGAELGAWIWQPLTDQLEHRAVAVDLPGRDADPAMRRNLRLTDAIDTVAAAVDGLATHRVVLVVHSFAGMLAPAATAARGDRISDVVWLAATVPVAGRSFVDDQPLPARWILKVLYRLRPSGARSPEAENRKALCHGLAEEACRMVLSRRVVEPPGMLTDPAPTVHMPAGVVSHHVTMRDDRAMPATRAVEMRSRLDGAVAHELDGGHLPMLERPAELAALLHGLA